VILVSDWSGQFMMESHCSAYQCVVTVYLLTIKSN